MRPRRSARVTRAPRGHNPYFRRGGGEGLSRRIFGSVGIVIVATMAGFLLFSNWLAIDEVLATGATGEMNEQVDAHVTTFLSKRRPWLVSRSHRWFLPQERIQKDLLATFPLNAVSLSKKRSTLHVELNEKIGLFHVIRGDAMYAVDRDGAILYAVDDLDRIRIQLEREQGDGPPLIVDRRNQSSVEPEDVATETLERIVSMFQLIEGSNMLTPISAEITDEPGRVNVQTDAGVVLYMSTERSVEAQVSKLQLLVDKQLVPIAELSYIDLRFENRLYYH